MATKKNSTEKLTQMMKQASRTNRGVGVGNRPVTLPSNMPQGNGAAQPAKLGAKPKRPSLTNRPTTGNRPSVLPGNTGSLTRPQPKPITAPYKPTPVPRKKETM